MSRYIFLPVFFILFLISCIEHKFYLAGICSFAAAVACLANLQPLGATIVKNRGKFVLALMVFSLVFFVLKV